MPTFFSPSVLLRKLRTFIPIVTKDYQKAFLQAITTKTHDPRKTLSLPAQRSVAYFKRLGIDDVNVMVDFLSDEIFLETFKETEAKGEAEQFIESELNKQYNKKKHEVDEANLKIVRYEQDISQSLEEKARIANEKEQIEKEKEAKEEEVVLYQNALQSLNKKVQKLEGKVSKSIPQTYNPINFEAAEKEKENKRLFGELEGLKVESRKAENRYREQKREEFYRKELFRWRFKAWLELIVLTILFVSCIIYIFYLGDWSFQKSTQLIKQLQGDVIAGGIASILFFVLNSIIIKSLVDKYRNHSNIKAYKEGLKVPDEIKPLI